MQRSICVVCSLCAAPFSAAALPALPGMQALCLSLCPLSELRDGLNARPHRLEQWSDEMRRSHPCEHLQRTGELLPTAPPRARGYPAAASPSPPLLEWLAPVAAYRRSASASASSSSAASLAAESALTRPLPVLLAAADHLFECVWRRRDDGINFEAKYAFVNDRLRQIKKEITMQMGGTSTAESTPKEGGASGSIESTSSSSPSAASAAASAASVAASSSASLSILERSVRFYALSGWVLMGSADSGFDAQMNRERLQDCLQALIELYPSTCRGAAEAVAASSASSAAASSAALDALVASAADPSSLSSLLDRSDRFRSYSVLLRLQHGPWIELQSMIAEQQRCAAEAQAASAAASHPAAGVNASSRAVRRSSPPVPRHLLLASHLCAAYSTCDYFRFFSLYKQLCDPADPSGRFDPVCMALLAPHILPLQIGALRRISLAYQPNAFYPLSTLRRVLALPSVPDASLLCKSLCGLTVRRPEHWVAMGLAAQETDEAVAAADAAADAEGAAAWGVQIKRGSVVEADSMVFAAFYTRELRRRLRRVQAQAASHSGDGDPTAAAFGLDESAGVISSVSSASTGVSSAAAAPAASAVAPDASAAASWEDVATDSAASPAESGPLWIFTPHTRWSGDCLQRWIQGGN